MIGKLLNLPYSKIAKTVHGEMEQSKRHTKQHNSKHQEEAEKEKEEKIDITQNYKSEITQTELSIWVKEINALECYLKNDLKFILTVEGHFFNVKLIDKNEHPLQEYLPVQFQALYLQLKTDKADSQKGTILNVNC